MCSLFLVSSRISASRQREKHRQPWNAYRLRFVTTWEVSAKGLSARQLGQA